jgi:hypothetical protein
LSFCGIDTLPKHRDAFLQLYTRHRGAGAGSASLDGASRLSALKKLRAVARFTDGAVICPRPVPPAQGTTGTAASTGLQTAGPEPGRDGKCRWHGTCSCLDRCPKGRNPMTATTISTGHTLLLAAALSIAGCAGSPERPTAQIGIAGAAIQQAEQNDAQTHSLPALERARSKLAEAERAADNGDNARALRLAEEATADAELASARAEAATSQAAADEVRASIATLRREVE